ncbi:MAG: MFS transporter, partial [Propionibacteriaceae bacterium]
AIPLAVLWPMLACLGIGIIFGSTQTGLTAMFTARHAAGYAGLVYGAVGIGSGAASILVGRLARWFAIPTRVAGGSFLLGLAGVLFMTLPSLSIAIVTAIALGVGAGVSLVSSFDWMERCAPRHLVATMMTLLATCITLGVSIGAAVAGYIATNPAHAFSLILVASILGLSASAGMRFLSSHKNT